MLAAEPEAGRDSTIYDALNALKGYAYAELCLLVFIVLKYSIDRLVQVNLQCSLILRQFQQSLKGGEIGCLILHLRFQKKF